VWFKKWNRVLEWNEPFAKWFDGGRLNVSVNCLDRHLGTHTANKAALIWEGELAGAGKAGEERTLTYKQLHHEVCRFANALKNHGVAKGDRVLIYMPMVPEAAVAMLACTRIGAVHSVVFGGFSAQSVADRIQDSQAKLVVTADGGFRRGVVVPLKQNVDEALTLKDAKGQLLASSIQKVIVLRRVGSDVPMQADRDSWWHDEVEHASATCPPEEMDSESPLFILYTSGSTGKPKGILHTTAGYLLYTKLTTKYVFDLRDEDVYWCTADVGWVTGHSYVVYGPLASGATSFMYEGAPNFPESDRFWRIVAKYGVTVFYTGDGHPGVYEMGNGLAEETRPKLAPSAGHRRRADQSRGVDVVSRAYRRQSLPHCGHLVANGDRRNHDHAAPRSHPHETRVGHAAILWHCA
jgi:acetyl-CoA synthetase